MVFRRRSIVSSAAVSALAQSLTLKLVAARGTERLLDGQAVGWADTDRRTDVVATALYAGLTVEDLTWLDPEYAPSFNGACGTLCGSRPPPCSGRVSSAGGQIRGTKL